MAANDEFPRGITKTAVALGTIPTITFPAVPKLAWRLNDLGAVVTPAKWEAQSIGNAGPTSAAAAAIIGASHHITVASFKIFLQGGGAPFSDFPQIQDSSAAKWSSNINIGVVNGTDTADLVGQVDGIQGSQLQAFFGTGGAGQLQTISIGGYTVVGPLSQAGQYLRVWDGPSGTGTLLAQYLLSNSGGQDGTYDGTPELFSSPGNALTIDTDGAVSFIPFTLTGNLVNSSGSSVTGSSIRATAQPN